MFSLWYSSGTLKIWMNRNGELFKRYASVFAERLEAVILNIHGLSRLRASIEYIKEKSQKNILAEVISLAEMFYQGIKDIPGIIFYRD